MSSLIYRIAHACYHARLRVVAAWVAIMVVLGVLTVTVGGTFDDDFTIPGTSSQVALDQLKMTFPIAAESSATIVILAPEGKTVYDPEVRAEIEAGAAAIEDEFEWVSGAQLPFNEYIKGLISDDETAALLSVRVKDVTVFELHRRPTRAARRGRRRPRARHPGERGSHRR